MKVVRSSASRTGRLYPQETFLVLIFPRGWVDPRAVKLSEGICHWKIEWPPAIDPGTVRLIAQRLNHYVTPSPCFPTESMHMNDEQTDKHPTKYFPALALKWRPEFWSFKDVVCYLLALKHKFSETIAVHRSLCGPDSAFLCCTGACCTLDGRSNRSIRDGLIILVKGRREWLCCLQHRFSVNCEPVGVLRLSWHMAIAHRQLLAMKAHISVDVYSTFSCTSAPDEGEWTALVPSALPSRG